jgi:hypothetical protein
MGDLHACADAVHAAIRSDRRRWEAETTNRRPWPGESIEIAECKACGSTIAREKPVVTDLGPAYARSCR